ncbi:MAG: hypothetical protein JKX70_11955 [Phycisphaerales bacterium]|nr:hypothetical protein [Phycisphaerales bacterium]
MKHLLSAAIALSLLCPNALGEVIHFQNTNPAFDTLKLFDATPNKAQLGQALNITQSAFDQPEIGDLPGGSIFFMQFNGLGGDFVWMGMGRLTMTARSTKETLIPDPFAGQLIAYFGPQGFEGGDTIGTQSNFVDGFRAMHGVNNLTDEFGIFTVDEVFSVGIVFEQSDGLHYGFAEFERTTELHNGELDIQWHPTQWGYETVAGVGIIAIPSPSVMAIGCFGLLGCSKRKRSIR